MLDQFLKASIPEPVVCCNIRLLPFSLGRFFLLKKFCPTYLSGGKRDFVDLLASCLICSQKYQDAIDTFSGLNGDLSGNLKKWAKRLSKNNHFEWMASSRVFDKYISDATANYPVVKAKAQGGGDPCDESLWPFVTFMGCLKAGQKREDILEQPIAFSRWVVAGFGMMEGNVEIIDGDQFKKDQERANKFVEELRQKGLM